MKYLIKYPLKVTCSSEISILQDEILVSRTNIFLHSTNLKIHNSLEFEFIYLLFYFTFRVTEQNHIKCPLYFKITKCKEYNFIFVINDKN